MDHSSFHQGHEEYCGTASFILAQSALVNSTDSFLWVATTDCKSASSTAVNSHPTEQQPQQNVCILVETARAAEDFGLDPLLMCDAVVWFTHWSASRSQQPRSWPFLVFPIAAYSSKDSKEKNMQVVFGEKNIVKPLHFDTSVLYLKQNFQLKFPWLKFLLLWIAVLGK